MNDMIWYSEFDREIDEVPGTWSLAVDKSLLKKNDAKYFKQKTFGRFCCSRCKRQWFSTKILILFRMQRGIVTMRIFKQACRKCGLSIMQEPAISYDNVQIVISNVVSHIQRVFYRKENVNDDRPANNFGKLDGPHDEEHCEACRYGPHDEEHCEACRYGLCDSQTLFSPEQSSSGFPTALAVGLGVGGVALAALAALSLFSDNKEKEKKREDH